MEKTGPISMVFSQLLPPLPPLLVNTPRPIFLFSRISPNLVPRPERWAVPTEHTQAWCERELHWIWMLYRKSNIQHWNWMMMMMASYTHRRSWSDDDDHDLTVWRTREAIRFFPQFIICAHQEIAREGTLSKAGLLACVKTLRWNFLMMVKFVLHSQMIEIKVKGFT